MASQLEIGGRSEHRRQRGVWRTNEEPQTGVFLALPMKQSIAAGVYSCIKFASI